VLAEATGIIYIEPVEGFDSPRRADVTAWRLLPGTAWLASRALAQIGRYPAALLTLDPYRKEFLIRLGAYFGHQTTIRASHGTLGQRLTVAAILAGIREPVPSDRRLLGKLHQRFESALDELAEQKILASWQWEREPSRGREGFLKATIAFVYHQPSVEAHAAHHRAAKRALASASVQQLLPDGATRGPENSPMR
jgi:hypothetical protein